MPPGGDRINLIEAFLACKYHFIIRQRGDRMVILENGVRMILRDLVGHLFAATGDWLVYHKVYLPDVERPLYGVAYHSRGYNEPVILLTDMVVEDRNLALQQRKRHHGSKREAIGTFYRHILVNGQQMRYDVFRAKGYDISSGSAEGVCKNVVGKRLKQSGMI
ncbi:MAG: hypothetical protein ACE5NM_12385 [Sedimentisphaerales bacterium]